MVISRAYASLKGQSGDPVIFFSGFLSVFIEDLNFVSGRASKCRPCPEIVRREKFSKPVHNSSNSAYTHRETGRRTNANGRVKKTCLVDGISLAACQRGREPAV